MTRIEESRNELLAKYAAGRRKDEWLAEADWNIEYFGRLKKEYPERVGGCALVAALEWRDLLEHNRTTLSDCEHLFNYAVENRRGMPWIAFAETLSAWMYSLGHQRALALSRQIENLDAMVTAKRDA